MLYVLLRHSEVNKTLTNLDMRRNDISESGATCLAEAIEAGFKQL